MDGPSHLRDLPGPARLKLAASALLAVPITVLLVFAVGEVAAGDLTGLQHLLQALPLCSCWRLRGATRDRPALR